MFLASACTCAVYGKRRLLQCAHVQALAKNMAAKKNTLRFCSRSYVSVCKYSVTVTSDKEILPDIKGMKIELLEIPLRSSHRNAQTTFTIVRKPIEIIELEIAKMLGKGIIEKVAHDQMKLYQVFLQADKRRHSQAHNY